MSNLNLISSGRAMLLAGILAGGISVSPAGAQSAAPAATPSVVNPARTPSVRVSRRASMYYESVWGVDSLNVKTVESGEIIRFTWRVLDATKAKLLSDKGLEPSLIDPQAGVSLVIPTMDQVGQLRQSGTPVVGRSYWMAFSNSGRVVRRGDHVSVVIGQFRADGLVVE